MAHSALMVFEFGTFTSHLTTLQTSGITNLGGEVVQGARGNWGGYDAQGVLYSTAWLNNAKDNFRHTIHRPSRNVSGLKEAWEQDRIESGRLIRIIHTRHRRLADDGSNIEDSALSPYIWIIEDVADDHALVVPLFVALAEDPKTMVRT